MLADYVAGMPVDAIASKYGVHQTAAPKAARRAGLELRQDKPPSAARASKRKWQKANPEKRKAHKLVEMALRSGSITRSSCERCGSANAQAHHDDYTKPLDVIWLCPKDHKARHAELKNSPL